MNEVTRLFYFFTVNYCLNYMMKNIGYSYKFNLKVGAEESIVNAPRITDHGSAI
jgi:hypothetical protein